MDYGKELISVTIVQESVTVNVKDLIKELLNIQNKDALVYYECCSGDMQLVDHIVDCSDEEECFIEFR